MIRCLIDEDSFDKLDFKHPHKDLEQLSDHLEWVAILLDDSEVLELPQDLKIVVTCNHHLLPWDTPGQHDPETQTVYLCGVYKFKDLVRYLCHELIHVEQVHRGWLRFDRKDHVLSWFGVPLDWGDEKTHEEYLNLPWERDAWAREPKVFSALKAILKDDEWLKDMVATRSEQLERQSLH